MTIIQFHGGVLALTFSSCKSWNRSWTPLTFISLPVEQVDSPQNQWVSILSAHQSHLGAFKTLHAWLHSDQWHRHADAQPSGLLTAPRKGPRLWTRLRTTDLIILKGLCFSVISCFHQAPIPSRVSLLLMFLLSWEEIAVTFASPPFPSVVCSYLHTMEPSPLIYSSGSLTTVIELKTQLKTY